MIPAWSQPCTQCLCWIQVSAGPQLHQGLVRASVGCQPCKLHGLSWGYRSMTLQPQTRVINVDHYTRLQAAACEKALVPHPGVSIAARHVQCSCGLKGPTAEESFAVP